MDIAKLTDLELAKTLSQQQQLLFQISKNLETLQAELNKRLESVKPNIKEDDKVK